LRKNKSQILKNLYFKNTSFKNIKAKVDLKLITIQKKGPMKKIKLYPIISVIIAVIFFGTAASCNMCGINLTTETTASTATESDTGETAAGTTSAEETAAETAAEETTEESSEDIQLVDISQLTDVFAIANESGDQLITFYSDEDVTEFEDFNGAIGEDGHFYTIEYVEKQNSNDQDSGRVVSDNFDNMEGYIYNVLEDNLIANNTYYICNSDVINEDNLLTTVSAGIIDLDADTRAQIEDIKGRNIQEGWIIDEYSDGTQILIVVFEPDGNNLLMSIALKTTEGIKLMDYPVVSDGQSAWRVDDGGKIDPKLFSILFSTPTNEGLLIGVCWAGAEGENTFFLLEEADALTQLPSEIYRYWSPV